MDYVNLASKNALKECQSQFHNAAWNCTDFQKSRKDTIYGRHAKAGKTRINFTSFKIFQERKKPRSSQQ